ncbi:hypothetical protein [Cellulomonas sp. P5_C6]
MLAHRRLLVPLAVGLVLAGAGTAVWLNRSPAPLAPLAVETLAPPTGIHLPAHVVAGGHDGTAFSLDAPAQGELGGNLYTIPLAAPPTLSSVGILWLEPVDVFRSLESYTDWQRRDPEDSHVVGDPVIEHSALGVAVRKDLVLTAGVTITQWAVEHDGRLYLVEWSHRPDDATWQPTVEAMIASWRWA